MLKEIAGKRVAVLGGGQSGEREVSFRSAQGVLDVLTAEGIDAVLLDPVADLAAQLREAGADVVFNALHGGAGEDGTVQGVLEMLNIPYTGCGVFASALTMDKLATQAALRDNGLPIPDYMSVFRNTKPEEIVAGIERIGLPVVTKPSAEGSSLGVTICSSVDEAVGEALQLVKAYGRIMIEKFVSGIEITVGVIGWGENVRALPVLEIVSHNDFYDYEAKYTKGLTDLICPARIPDSVTAVAFSQALQAHRVTDCHGISRCDMHVDKDGTCWIHEINSMPGLTETSDVPHEAEAAGITYRELVFTILESAFHR